MEFDRHLTLRNINGNIWENMHEFSLVDEKKNKIATVPAGFITDLASVPFPFVMFIPKSGKYNQAAVLHDFMYHDQGFSRRQADKIFLDVMESLGVNFFKRRIMYMAVRGFGWLVWRKKKR